MAFSASNEKQSLEDRYLYKADSILALMTLEEKLGQLNLPAAGDITTGQASRSNVAKNADVIMVVLGESI